MENYNTNKQDNCCGKSNCCHGHTPERDDQFNSNDSVSLHAVAKTTLMALHSLEETIKRVDKVNEIYPFMIDQIDAYNELKGKVEKAFEIISEKAEKVNVFNDLMLSGSIKMNTMIDSSSSHIAEMLIQGTTMGIIEITKVINENCESISKPCRDLLYDIMFAMNSFIADMKKFL